MLLFVLLAVFIAGLMVGRTPEYLGKKIEAREVKLVADRDALRPAAVLVFTALAVATKYGAPSIYNSGPQGFSETLYAYTSQGNNNGSAFAGYTGFVQPNAPGNVGAFGITFADLLGGWRCCSAASCRCSRRSRSPARSPRSASPGRRRHVPHRHATFVVLLIGVIVIVARAHLLPRPPARPIVQGLTDPALLRPCAATSSTSALAVVVFTSCSGSPIRSSRPGWPSSLFPNKSDGSQIERDGKVVGSRLIGQDFRSR